MTTALNLVNEENTVNTTSDTNMSENIADIATALSNAQFELESADKGSSGYGYNYSDLATVIQTAKPVLKKFGLAVTQLISNSTNGNPVVTTILTHSSGQFFQSVASIPIVEMKGCNIAQQIGASISYLRRYSFQAILCMSSEDNDASSSGFSKPTSKSVNTPVKADNVTEEEKSTSAFRGRRRKSDDSDDI